MKKMLRSISNRASRLCEWSESIPAMRHGDCYVAAFPAALAPHASAGATNPFLFLGRVVFWISVILLTLLATANPAGAQSGSVVSDVRVVSEFGKRVTFLARIQSPLGVQSATVTFREEGGIQQTQPLTLSPDGTAGYTYDASVKALKPFARIVFWFTVTLADGTQAQSENYNFDYVDNRFPWQAREDGVLRIHWVEGDASFGDAVLDVTRRGLQSVSTLITVDLTEPIDIWVYPTAEELQGALLLGGQSWVAGHASPELGVVMVSVAPGADQSIQLERQAPHELAHVLLYRRVGPNYDRLPVWLREGMASMAELYPDPDYDTVLKEYAGTNSLIPLTDLCDSFPPDTASAYLAYAESKSFTQYIVDNYGTSGLTSLALAYADGLDCEQGARQALGPSLSQLETRWRESALGENRGGVILSNLLPYLILLILLLAAPVTVALGRIARRK